MLPPYVEAQQGRGGWRHASALRRRGSVERAVGAKFVVIIPECLELARQVDRVPEQHAIEVLAADSADKPFYEWMRSRDIGHRLDLIDLEEEQFAQEWNGTMPTLASTTARNGPYAIDFAYSPPLAPG